MYDIKYLLKFLAEYIISPWQIILIRKRGNSHILNNGYYNRLKIYLALSLHCSFAMKYEFLFLHAVNLKIVDVLNWILAQHILCLAYDSLMRAC